MDPAAVRAIRVWIDADWRRSLRIDHFPGARRGYQWSAVGIDRSNGKCVKNTVSGATMQMAMARFARTLGAQ